MNIPTLSASTSPVTGDPAKSDLPTGQNSEVSSSLSALTSSQNHSPSQSSSINISTTHVETRFDKGKCPESSTLDLQTWISELYDFDSLRAHFVMFPGLSPQKSRENEILWRVWTLLDRSRDVLVFRQIPLMASNWRSRDPIDMDLLLNEPVVQLACLPAPRGEIGRLNEAEPEWLRDVTDAVELFTSLVKGTKEFPADRQFVSILVWLRILLRADSVAMAEHAYGRVRAWCERTPTPDLDAIPAKLAVKFIKPPERRTKRDESGHFEQKAEAYAHVLREILNVESSISMCRMATERDDIMLREFAKVMILENNFHGTLVREVWKKCRQKCFSRQSITLEL